MKDLLKKISLAEGLSLILIIMFFGGVGGIVLERLVFPYAASWPVIWRLKFLESGAPIVITKREEIRISEAINNLEVVNKIKGTLVTLYLHDGTLVKDRLKIAKFVSGMVITNDGIIVTPSVSLASQYSITAALPDGRYLPAEIVAADALTGLAFLKVDAADLPIIKHGQSNRLKAGEVLLALRAGEGGGNLAVNPAVVTAEALAQGSLTSVYNFNRLNLFLDSDLSLEPQHLGSVLVDKDGLLVGFITQIGKEAVTLRAEDLRLAVNNFLDDEKFAWPSLKVSYQNFDKSQAVLLGLPERYGTWLKSVVGPLKDRDFVYAVDGVDLTAEEGFQQVLLGKKPGETARLKLIRNGEETELELNL